MSNVSRAMRHKNNRFMMLYFYSKISNIDLYAAVDGHGEGGGVHNTRGKRACDYRIYSAQKERKKIHLLIPQQLTLYSNKDIIS